MRTIEIDPLNQLRAVNSPEELRFNLLNLYPEVAESELLAAVVAGVGPEGERLVALLRQQGVHILDLLDSDPDKVGTQVGGLVVRDPGSCIAREALANGSCVAIVASNKPSSTIRLLTAMGAQVVIPFALLQVARPESFPPHMFFKKWFETLFEGKEAYSKLSEELGDELSRETLRRIIELRLTMNLEALQPVIRARPYIDEDLVRLPADSVCVDAGAYNGDSADALLIAYPSVVARVMAFEPHPATFRDLEERFARDPRVLPLELALSSRAGLQPFSEDSSRASSLMTVGSLVVKTDALDNVLKGARVDYIKMNIEGAEVDALEGSAETIRLWRPTLAIAAYHAPDHLTRIPTLVHGLCKDYELFLRQQDDGFVETVLYARPTDRD